ncbi:MAG: glycosyltransferase family 9 protein [Bacteroidota bacterium]
MKKFELLLKQLFLRLLLFFVSTKRSDKPVHISSSTRIMFIRLNRIGDALVCTPLLKQVKDSLNPVIYLLADKKNHFVFNNNPSVDHVVVFEKGLKGFREILKYIRSENIDVLVDLHDDVSTTVTYLTAFAHVSHKFALRKSNSLVYTKTINKPDPSKVHVVDRILSLAGLLGFEPKHADANICYYPEDKSYARADSFLNSKYRDRKFLAGVNISAGSEARFWGVDNFKRLIKLLKESGIDVLVMCTTRDLKHALQIADNNNDMIFYSPSFDVFSAMISRLDVLITPDTSVVHIASCFCIPVFGLYVKYNTEDMIWSPYRSYFDYVVTTEPELEAITFEETAGKLRDFVQKIIPARS